MRWHTHDALITRAVFFLFHLIISNSLVTRAFLTFLTFVVMLSQSLLVFFDLVVTTLIFLSRLDCLVCVSLALCFTSHFIVLFRTVVVFAPFALQQDYVK